MGRGSSWPGSYREWEAAQRANEQQRKIDQRERVAKEAADRDEDAAARTHAVEQRVTELEGLLRSSLARDPRVRLDSLLRRIAVPPLDLGEASRQRRVAPLIKIMIWICIKTRAQIS